MKYGVLAGNNHINARIYQLFDDIDAEDVNAFVRKFRREKGEHRMHTFRELIVGSHLRKYGLDARYEQEVQGKTPDWVIRAPDGDVLEIVDVVTLHQRKALETDMVGTLVQGEVWTGWMTIPPDHIYAKIQQKANRYSDLSSELDRPYLLYVFGEFLASIDPEEIAHVVHKHHGGLFTKVPWLVGVVYFTESSGTYKYAYFSNEGAKLISPTLRAFDTARTEE